MSEPLFLVPLRSEALAVRIGAPRASIRRIGMGPARATAARAVLDGADRRSMVLLGLCGGLVPGLNAGDVIVASSVRTVDGDRPIVLSGATVVADLLSARGINARADAIVSSSRILHGDENRQLANAGGAVAVDMESYWCASLADRHPLTVVRVVIDTLGKRVMSPLFAQSCVRSFHTLSKVARVLLGGLPTDSLVHLTPETGEI